MSFDTDLVALLQTAAPSLGTRVFPDFAPVSTPRPYCTFQQIGGHVLNLVEGAAPGMRNSMLQVSVWADTRAEAISIIHAIEAAMCAATAFIARPVSAFVADFDADIPVYGSRQDFSCWHST